VWACWVDDALYFHGAPHTRWANNLAKNPAVTIHLERGDEAVILEGTVEDLPTLTDHELAARIVTYWNDKYGRMQPDPIREGIFRLRPQSVRAWSTASLADGTKWELV